MTAWSGHAVLQIGVPELEDWVVARTRHYDTRFLSEDPGFRHAHITVLAPLAEWDAAAIAGIAADTAPFGYRLERLGVHPRGFINLLPAPDAAFRRLTERVWAAHPGVIPFGAPKPQPHLTLDMLAPQVSVASTRASLGDLVPADCLATALELVWYGAGACRVIDCWPLTGRK